MFIQISNFVPENKAMHLVIASWYAAFKKGCNAGKGSLHSLKRPGSVL